MIIDGKKESANLREEIKNEILEIKKKINKNPSLTDILLVVFILAFMFLKNLVFETLARGLY